MLDRLADRLVLCPSTDPISAERKRLRKVAYPHGELAVFTQRWPAEANDIGIFVLKFVGAGGRAERSNKHPADVWNDLGLEIWTMNPPGYGESSGPPRMARFAQAAHAVFEAAHREAAGRPILVMGNSLGTASALYLAARMPVAGVVLRNATPLKQLIAGHHGSRGLWVGSWILSRFVPRPLDSVANAAQCGVPAVFLVSGADEIVPPAYQRQIIDAYAGEKQVLVMEGATHTDQPSPSEKAAYRQALGWLREKMLP